MEEGRSTFKILTSKLPGKRSSRTPRRRWEDNIGMDLKEIGINIWNRVDSAVIVLCNLFVATLLVCDLQIVIIGVTQKGVPSLPHNLSLFLATEHLLLIFRYILTCNTPSSCLRLGFLLSFFHLVYFPLLFYNFTVNHFLCFAHLNLAIFMSLII